MEHCGRIRADPSYIFRYVHLVDQTWDEEGSEDEDSTNENVPHVAAVEVGRAASSDDLVHVRVDPAILIGA